ncbi:MAG TPA: hypothetical protein VFT29_17140 [Gemmatimonadaceae bacterium]|nr:hypothetical protein [Gemmatimonadaceae bacterium]
MPCEQYMGQASPAQPILPQRHTDDGGSHEDRAGEDRIRREARARVGYEFYVDGKMYRDADSVLPVIAERWRAGDQVLILYLPEAGCDSVIVAVE